MEPRDGAVGLPQQIETLEQLISDGWSIEPPVLARRAWASRPDGRLDYHFILAREAQRTLVVLAASDDVRGFCANHDLAVARPPAETDSQRGRRSPPKSPWRA